MTALEEEWEKMTGALETAMASRMVSAETWARSTSMPRRFISLTTCLPKGERPPLRGKMVDSASEESALESDGVWDHGTSVVIL